jgi:hypothetical protein
MVHTGFLFGGFLQAATHRFCAVLASWQSPRFGPVPPGTALA